jgi:hypothetical protein
LVAQDFSDFELRRKVTLALIRARAGISMQTPRTKEKAAAPEPGHKF